MRVLTIEKVLVLHTRLTARFGLSAADGVRDYAGVRQWIAAHTYGGDDV